MDRVAPVRDTCAVSWLPTWSDPAHVISNALTLSFVMYMAWRIATLPAAVVHHRRNTKLFLVLAALSVNLYVGGFLVPIGALWCALRYRHGSAEMRRLDNRQGVRG
jgi:hypothetical protein